MLEYHLSLSATKTLGERNVPHSAEAIPPLPQPAASYSTSFLFSVCYSAETSWNNPLCGPLRKLMTIDNADFISLPSERSPCR